MSYESSVTYINNNDHCYLCLLPTLFQYNIGTYIKHNIESDFLYFLHMLYNIIIQVCWELRINCSLIKFLIPQYSDIL